MTDVNERELGWDDQIVKDDEFILLPEGDYDFVVSRFERARFDGSNKMPPCNQAIVFLKIHHPELGDVEIRHSMLLHTKTEWMLSSFFTSIGQKKKGEPLKMNWPLVPGSSGRCKLGFREYNDNKYNEVKKFYPKEEKPFTPGSF